MTFEEFRDSLSWAQPPAGLSLALLGLWWDAKGDWSRAHEAAQQAESADCFWVHAYLHRKEGDAANADYWYRRAGQSANGQTLEDEWRSIVEDLLG